MATHFSVLAWRITGTGEPGGAAVYVVTQSRTRLKWLSSSSSREAWHTVVHGVAKSQTWLSDWTELTLKVWLLDHIFFNLVFIFYLLFLAALTVCCCAWVFSSCQQVGLSTSFSLRQFLVAEHGLNTCGTWALLLCSILDLPGPGIKPMSPALTDF